jgi:hypothetical protein
MTVKAPKTTALTTPDGNVYEVAKMSPAIQELVTYLDEFKQEEMDAHVRLQMAQAAIRDVQTQLLNSIQRERAEAEQKAAAMGIIPATPAEVAGEGESDE